MEEKTTEQQGDEDYDDRDDDNVPSEPDLENRRILRGRFLGRRLPTLS